MKLNYSWQSRGSRVKMAKLYFRYGVMSSSKSLNLIATAHNYESQGKHVLTFKSSIDDRDGKNVIASRAGLSRKAIPLEEPTDFLKMKAIIEAYQYTNDTPVKCILVDEAQLLQANTIDVLSEIVDELNIPVICYGLKTDFQTNFFDGSARLLQLADETEEIKTICSCPDCTRRAVLNLRLANGVPVYEGDQVQIGDDEYRPVCRKHYYSWLQ